MLTKVIATGVGAVIAGVAAYQVTTNYLGDCGSACSHDAKADTALVSAPTEGDSCCPLTGSKGTEVLAVANTESASCATACTEEMKAACDKPCSETDAVVLEASLTEAASCSTEKTACTSAEKLACSTGDSTDGVEILMVANEDAESCTAEKTACGSGKDSDTGVEILMVAGEEAKACTAEKTACETKTECETEKLAAADDTTAGNG